MKDLNDDDDRRTEIRIDIPETVRVTSTYRHAEIHVDVTRHGSKKRLAENLLKALFDVVDINDPRLRHKAFELFTKEGGGEFGEYYLLTKKD